MYKIDSKAEKPDIKYLEDTVKLMMIRGVNVADLNELYNRFVEERDELASEIAANYGISNPNSTKQVNYYLSNLDSPEVYENCYIDGKWTSNKDALGNLSLIGYQFATDLLDYRRAKKYAESIKSMQDAVGNDGRVHPTVTLAKTNRINYSSPALMNIPKPLLWHIIKPNTDGNVLISADIKNQEPNILINILGVDSLKEALDSPNGLYEFIFAKAFKATARLNILVIQSEYKPGIISNEELASLGYVPPVYYTPDPPAAITTYYNNEQVRVIDTTSIVVLPGTPFEEIDFPREVLIETVNNNQYLVPVTWGAINKKKLQDTGIIEVKGELEGLEIRCEGIYRKEFKIAWNAMTYGAGLFGVEKMCKHIDGKRFYNYFSSIPEFRKYRNNCKSLADSGRNCINTFFGTTLYSDEENSFKLQRVLMDLPIQGTAADILSLLMRHTNEEIEKNYKGKLEIYYTRHDEMIFEADRNWVMEVGIDNVLSIIQSMTEHQVDDWKPFKVEVKELKPGKLYIDDDTDE